MVLIVLHHCKGYTFHNVNLRQTSIEEWKRSQAHAIFCNKHEENTEHILFGYASTQAVWFGCDLSFCVRHQNLKFVLEWTVDVLDSVGNKKEKLELLGRVAFMGWFIWKERNNFNFNHKVVNLPSVIQSASSFRWEFTYAVASDNHHIRPSHWEPSQRGF